MNTIVVYDKLFRKAVMPLTPYNMDMHDGREGGMEGGERLREERVCVLCMTIALSPSVPCKLIFKIKVYPYTHITYIFYSKADTCT